MACATVCALNRSFTALTHGSHLSFFTMRDDYQFNFPHFFGEKTLPTSQTDLKVEVELNVEGRAVTALPSHATCFVVGIHLLTYWQPFDPKKPVNKLSWLGAQPTILPA